MPHVINSGPTCQAVDQHNPHDLICASTRTVQRYGILGHNASCLSAWVPLHWQGCTHPSPSLWMDPPSRCRGHSNTGRSLTFRMALPAS